MSTVRRSSGRNAARRTAGSSADLAVAGGPEAPLFVGRALTVAATVQAALIAKATRDQKAGQGIAGP
jgi:hypothetical protein